MEAAGLMERWEQWGGVPERGQSVKQEDRAHSSEEWWERGSYGGAGPAHSSHKFVPSGSLDMVGVRVPGLFLAPAVG